MNKITFKITVFFSILLTALSIAQVSPKKGVTPPANFKQFHQVIQSEYSKGYYAEKFRERKEIREQISNRLLPESALATDTVFALTLMGQYTDLAGFYTQPQFQAQLYDGPNPTGTVTDYYSEISYNQLFFTGDAKGWYNLPGDISSYSPGGSGGGPKFVTELIAVADPTLNFADYIQYYDAQNRPHIGFLAVVHAGSGAEAGAYNIWSHRWNFTVYSGGAITTNDVDPVSGFNVIIDGPYAIMPERSGGSNTSGPIIEIGVFAHEFGHIFGLPDLYDTDNSSEGLGNWCLMAGGSWGGDGSSPETPVHMSAWCKIQLGWLTPINFISYQDSLLVPNVEENQIVYRMWRDGTISSQYFLIENRQKIGFDSKLFDSGFLIFHVDDAVGSNQNEDHYKVDLEQADGLRNLNLGQNRGDYGDPFPGASQNNRFDWDTNPNSKDYSLQNTFVSIRDIHKDGNIMVGNFEVGLRAGAYAFADPISINFGEVEVGTNSIIKSVIVANYGDLDLVITNIPSSMGNFNLESIISFPITLTTFDSLTLDFRFTPGTLGNFEGVYPVLSNDPTFLGFNFSGSSYINYPALDKTFYASSGAQNNGEILTVDQITGMGTLLGPSTFDGVKSISIDPTSGAIYGLVSNLIDAEIVKVNSGGGDSHLLFTLNLQQMAGIAFDTAGILHGISRSGMLYTINLEDGTYNLVIDAISTYTGIAFNSLTNELWASSANIVGPNSDVIFKVNLSTGDTIIVGHTGLGKRTNALTFDEDGNLYGIVGSESEPNEFISINIVNGVGTIIGSVGFNDIQGLAYAETGVTSVEGDNNFDNIPMEYVLKQNYPNPFNPSTMIDFSLPAEANVKLVIFNILGQEVIRLADGQMRAGNHSVIWNSNDAAGNQLTSGIYLYKLTASGNNGSEFQETKKMILIR